MKTNILYVHGFKRFVAVLLCAVIALGLFPAGTLAASEGQRADSAYGDTVIGSDGQPYHSPVGYISMTYNSNGTTVYVNHTGGSNYRHYVLTENGQATRWVYCIESGIRFGDSDDGYLSANSNNSSYFRQLPATAQQGIQLATLYGWQPGAALPLSGINADDWYMAAQVIIWEYQQQLRSDAYSRHANGPISADQFYTIVKDRPAERVYLWMLEQIASHSTIPSFAGTSAGSAPVHQLEWDAEAKVYRLTLTDTNNLNIDLQALSGSGVTITRDGNRYTFTSQTMIDTPVTFQYRKNVPIGEPMLIWGRSGYQSMMTGAEDPITFYVRIQTETYGTGGIVKTSEDGIVKGISFNITGNGVNETVITVANGRADISLLPGTYLVTEQPVTRYVTPAAQYITIESNQASTVHFSNILKKFRVKLTKADADTGTAQGDATLAGARYGLYSGGELVDIYTTGPDGSVLTRYYVCGDDWTIRELAPSTGYLLDETVHKVGASPKLYEVELNTTENRVTETVIYGNIRLVKHTDDPDPDVDDAEHSEDGNAGIVEKPESDAVFEIFLKSAGSYENAKKSERDLLTTDSDGFAVSKRLPYGRYTVHQVKGEEGKALVPDFTVFISQNGYTYFYILNNDAITARIRVEKRDAETGKIVPMPGTGFRIKDLSTGDFIAQTVYYPNPETLDIFYTSDEGWLMLPDELPVGQYELYEVNAPSGYVLSSEAVPFAVDGSEAVVTVVRENMPQKGKITITKTGEVFASVQENDDLYQPVYEVMGLPGAVYDLIADEDIHTGDGTLRVAKDTVVETLTTGDDATATSGLLYLGRYRLEEKQAPAGMVRNIEPAMVELTYAGQEVEVTQTALSLYDERQKVEIELVKALETDKLFGIGLADEYKDISFGLYAAHDLEALDGSIIPADGLLEVVSVRPEDGSLYAAAFAADLPFGSFYVKERTTNAAYVLDGKEYPVIFGYAGQDTAVVSLAANGGEAIQNKIIRGNIAGVKYGENPKGGDPLALAGAVLGLFAPDDKDMTKKTALCTVTTAENGTFSFESIPFGHWVIVEITSPAMYSVSPEQHHIYVGTDGQKIEIRVNNTLIRGSVQLIKTEAVDKPGAPGTDSANPFMRRLAGAVFELYEDTNGDKKLTESDKLLGTLEESDAGFHHKDGLLSGGYFVREKAAPKGFDPDENAYYFAITEDGQTVVIENGEKGRGFVNQAYRGNLKIVKDSSDGRRDGFAFKVKSANGSYSQTFTTTSTGVIEITGLRIGKYTVTEVKNRASQGYIVPDGATVEIRTGQTAVVQFFNEKPEEKIPETPTPTPTPATPTPAPTTSAPAPVTPAPTKPVPQTSDDSAVYLWMALTILALAGCGVCGVSYIRRRRRNGLSPQYRRSAAVIALLCAALLAASIAMLAKDMIQYRESTDIYAGLTEFVGEAEPRPAQPQAAADDATKEDTAAENVPAILLPSVDFTALREKGPDVAAWLMLEDTVINYPVAHADNNEYYLKHLYDGTANKTGCLFIDYENAPDFTDRNTIIYGHNMRDGSMFAELLHYREREYYDAHPSMFLMTPDGGYLVEVFAAFTASPNEAGGETSPWALSWKDSNAYAAWLEAMRGRSLFQNSSALEKNNHVLTLSTCINSGRDRFIVMGRLVPVN